MVYSIYFTLIVHIVLLPFFEHPAVVETPFWIPNLIEFVCLVIYMLRWIHLGSFQNRGDFYKKKINYIIPIAVFVRPIVSEDVFVLLLFVKLKTIFKYSIFLFLP